MLRVIRRLWGRLLPTTRTFYGFLPISIEGFALISTEGWLEGAVNSPQFGEFFLTGPEANGETCEVSSTKSSCFCDFRPLHGHAKNICLELHEQVVYGGAAVDPQTLRPGEQMTGPTGLAVAARVGSTRLIDNVVIDGG